MPLTRTTNAIAIVVAWGHAASAMVGNVASSVHVTAITRMALKISFIFATSLENPYHMTLRKST